MFVIDDVSSNARNGVLLAAKGESGQHGYLLEIADDRLLLTTTIDGQNKVITAGNRMSDGQWHLVKITRKSNPTAGNKIRLQLDNNVDITKEINSKSSVMRLQSLIIGAAKSKPQFDGSIQKFFFNKNDLIQQCREDRLPPEFKCVMRNRPKDLTGIQAPNPSDPVTFKTRSSFARIDTEIPSGSQLWRGKKYQISLELRTTEEDGILFWSGSKKLILANEKLAGGDNYSRIAGDSTTSWAVLETVNGRLNWIWKPAGTQRPQLLTSNKVISDNMWHSIEIKVDLNSNNKKAWFINIDKGRQNAENVRQKPIGGGSETFLKNNAVLIGGIPQYLLRTVSSPIVSTDGYQGCLGSIFINDQTRDSNRKEY